jgi:hypothetical protein
MTDRVLATSFNRESTEWHRMMSVSTTMTDKPSKQANNTNLAFFNHISKSSSISISWFFGARLYEGHPFLCTDTWRPKHLFRLHGECKARKSSNVDTLRSVYSESATPRQSEKVAFENYLQTNNYKLQIPFFFRTTRVTGMNVVWLTICQETGQQANQKILQSSPYLKSPENES